MTSLVVENSILRLVAIPELGGKVTSFFVKPVNRELLFQPQQPYRLPKVGDAFADYDTSGWDEILPTIEPCSWQGSTLPDHGEIWAKCWEMKREECCLYGKVECQSIPLLFERNICLEHTNCCVSYTVTNLSDKPQAYLWAWHALWDMNEVVVDIPGLTQIVSVHEGTFVGEKDSLVSWPWVGDHDLRYPSSWQGKKTAKVYAPSFERVSSAILTWPNVSLTVSWDSERLPYFGVWYNHGGFKDEYNLAIEPTTGYYDCLAEAFQRDKISVLSPFGVHQWELNIRVAY